ncbi:hypothetical protein MBAV_000023, partial [Candidatus Magnetobacterium bavaricum]
AIPADNSLQWTYGDKWSIDWNFTSADTCFFPGESMSVYAHVKDKTGKCNEILIGYSWFETNCLTSGIIQGCGILQRNTHRVYKEFIKDVDDAGKRISKQNIENVRVYRTDSKGYYVFIPAEQQPVHLRTSCDKYGCTSWYKIYKNYILDATNGSIKLPWVDKLHSDLFPRADLYLDYTYKQVDVLAGGVLQPFNSAWIGHPDLYWLVGYKGSLAWLKCSDFVEYIPFATLA